MFLALVHRLVEIQGDPPVYLALTPIGECFGVTSSAVSGWRMRAVEDGFLKQINEGKRGRAAEFEWLGRTGR